MYSVQMLWESKSDSLGAINSEIFWNGKKIADVIVQDVKQFRFDAKVSAKNG